jgi:hypothetical protein
VRVGQSVITALVAHCEAGVVFFAQRRVGDQGICEPDIQVEAGSLSRVSERGAAEDTLSHGLKRVAKSEGSADVKEKKMPIRRKNPAWKALEEFDRR